MTTIALNADRSLNVTNNRLVLISGLDEKVQILKNNLRFFKNEWFLDRTIGVPYYQDVFKKKIVPAELRAILVNTILSSKGVLELTELKIDLAVNRTLQVDFTVRFEEGPVTFSEEL